MYMELAILDAIQAHLRCNFFDVMMPLVTKLGNGGILWIISAAVLLLIPKTRKIGAAMLVALGLEVLCCNIILKPLVARIRPCDVNTAVQLLVSRPTDFSFPSGQYWRFFCSCVGIVFWKNAVVDSCWCDCGVDCCFPAVFVRALS